MFERNVFLNCPFDKEYQDLLRPLVFTVLYLKFRPRLALERSDSGESRIAKIMELIKKSKFGIHDLSRCQASRKGELFRLNMPLELGLDMGCKHFVSGKAGEKKILVLETERYRYQAALSDLSGSDIKAHHNDPATLVKVVRDWLVQEGKAEKISPSQIHGAFMDFMATNFVRLKALHWRDHEIASLPLPELFGDMEEWIARERH